MAPSLTIIHSRWQRLCRTSQQQQQQHSRHEPATAIGLAQPQYTRHRRIPPTPLLGKFFPLRKIRNCKKRQWKLIMIITTTERARASHHRAYSRSALEPGLETYLVRFDSKTPDGPGAPCETAKNANKCYSHCIEYLRQVIQCTSDTTLEGFDATHPNKFATTGWGST